MCYSNLLEKVMLAFSSMRENALLTFSFASLFDWYYCSTYARRVGGAGTIYRLQLVVIL
jgi:hypothetical protein